MKKCLLLAVALAISVSSLLAQQEVRFGQHRVVPEQNVARVRGATENALAAIAPTNGRVNVLMQFKTPPDAAALRRLESAGVVLEGYVGGNAYFAQVDPGRKPADFARHQATSVIGMRPEWKVSSVLAEDRVPAWADRGNGRVEVVVSWFANADVSYAVRFAERQGYAVGEASEVLSAMTLTLPAEEVERLASEPWVRHVAPVEPPQELLNYGGRALGAAMPAVQPVELGGRGLTGQGVRVGLWDGNIEHHVDYGNRAHVKEFEMSVARSGGHGMHTAGSIMGAGLLNPKARGMAPKAELYAYNFGGGRNGLSEAQEMLRAHKDYNIALTSNSYGFRLGRLCSFYDKLSYSFFSKFILTDKLSSLRPTLTHFHSAGNEQGACDKVYGTNIVRSKNVVYVGAVDEDGKISRFSSFGPMDDGRLTPTVAAKGVDVLSPVGSNGYELMNGTSMSCPTTAGMATLLTERHHQLHGGANANSALIKGLLANTADDRGNAGPDYKYGYGVVNLEAALTALEHGWYREGVVESGVLPKGHTVTVPAGVKQLRVMLTWIDPVVVKEYAYGEKALINDLDLSVSLAGSTTQPWVLDPNAPEKKATRGPDVLNNIEQVTIDNPAAGEMTINVTGQDKIREGAEQRYVLTWYFDYQRPLLLHPIGGELFSAGDALRVRTQNMEGETQVEISYDNGKTYQHLAAVKSAWSCGVIIPADAKQTTEARLRLTDSKGNVLVNAHPFTIAATPQKLNCTPAPCSKSGWKLEWTKVEGATGYAVLKADVPTGEWATIGEPKEATFDIPEEHVSADARNVYAVAVKLPDGKLGPRSLGVLASSTFPMALADADLPFVETFIDLPPLRVGLESGENMHVGWKETPAGLKFPLGSHVLQVKTTKDVTGDLFKVPSNVFTLKHCELDLTGVTAGKKLIFSTLNLMQQVEEPEDTQLRLMVDGVVVKNVLGEETYKATNSIREMVWDISAHVGKKVSLALQLASNSEGAGFAMLKYGVRESSDKPDVGVFVDSKVPSKPNMGIEELNLVVYSSMLTEAEQVPVVVSVDGKVVATQLVKNLAPFEERKVKIPVDFSTTEANGKLFDVNVSVSIDGDEKLRDNADGTTVYNMGKIYPLPPAKTLNFLGMKLPQDAKVIAEVSDPIVFTDDGGRLQGYGPGHTTSIKFKPSEPNKVIYLAVQECKLNGEEELRVYADGLKEDFVYENETPTHKFTASSASGAKAFTSRAADGSITVHFDSRWFNQAGDGWVAEVRQIDPVNTLELLPLVLEPNYPDGKATIKLKVKNLSPMDQTKVSGTLTLSNAKKPVTFEIPAIPASQEVEYTLPDPIDAPYPTCVDLTVQVNGEDVDVHDNVQTATLWNDKYWHGGTISTPAGQNLERVELYPQSVALKGLANKARHGYHLDKSVTLYKGTSNPLKVAIAKAPKEDGPKATLHVWIDFDDTDEKLPDAAPGYYSVALEKGKKEYDIPVDLTAATNVNPGNYRMRISVLRDDEKENFMADKNVEWGRSIDILAEVKDGANPSANDLEIAFITTLTSGTGLSATQEIEVEVVNNGHQEAKNVEVTLSLDGVEVAKETIAGPIPPYGESVEHKFTKTIDLSKARTHTVSVKVPDDGVMDNNEDSQEVISVRASATDKLYALSFEGSKEEYIDCSSIQLGTARQVTLEGWFKLNSPHLGTLFQGSGFAVLAVSGVGDGLPENGLAVLGRKMLVYTESDVLKPGQFHHVAVTFEDKSFFIFAETKVHVYIDGKEVELQGSTSAQLSYINLMVGRKFDGKAKMLRFWKTVRDLAGIQKDMNRSVRTASGLPPLCLAEFEVNEGADAYLASGNATTALIVSDRISDPDNPIWEEQKLISGANFEGQLLPSVMKDGVIEFLMPNGFTDFANVKGEIIKIWKDAKLTYNGKEITSATVFDFSNSEREITVSATATIFGISVTQNDVKIKLVTDKNPEAKIVKLDVLADSNPNLGKSVTVDEPGQTIVLSLMDKSESEMVDLSKVNVQFTSISSGATVRYGDKTAKVGGKLELNLTNPASVKVEAENGRDFAYYTLQVHKAQTITWDNSLLTLTYTNKVQPMDASSSSGLPITYRSENPNVAMIDAEGNLHTAGCGATKLIAMVPAQGIYAAATPVSREVKVEPAPLAIAPIAMEIEEGQRVPEVTLSFTGLLFNELTSTFKQPEYAVYKDAATVWTPAMGPLAPGVYPVKAKGETRYQDGNYMVQLGQGTLTVKPSAAAKRVNFAVTDGSEAVDGAEVSIDGAKLTTADGGKATLRLLPGKYDYEVAKADHLSASGTVKVEAGDVEVPVVLPKLEVTLTYGVDPASANGALFGELTQKLPKGGSGTEVTAVPESGYRFVGWSDGKTEASRKEENVESDLNLQASFAPVTYTVTYSVSEGGEWVSGEKTQKLKSGESTAEVEVKPLPGYIFSGWSDGVQGLKRTDKVEYSDITVQANFYKIFSLPLSEDFEFFSGLPKGWSVAQQDGTKGAWAIVKTTNSMLHPGTSGTYALVDSDAEGRGVKQNTDLFTPWIDVKGVTADIVVRFELLLKTWGASKLTLLYSFDGATWEELDKYEDNVNSMSMEYTIEAAKLAGKEKLQLKWNYEASFDGWAVVDNILVAKKDGDAVIEYFAGVNGKLTSASHADPTDYIKVSTPVGTPGEGVTAVADAGYRFSRWSDSKLDATRQDQENGRFTALFVPEAKPTHKVLYKAEPTGKIVGLSYQEVEEGSSSIAVTAEGIDARVRFDKWSDGRTDNPRVDENVKAGIDVTASFVSRFQVNYEILGDGHGELAATVDGKPLEAGAYVDAGTKVTFTATPKYGSAIKAWSGVTEATPDATSVEVEVSEDVQVKVEFVQLKGQLTIFAVKAGSEEPIEGATVTLEPFYPKQTDGAGKVEFGALLYDEYSFTVAAEGYKSVISSAKVEAATNTKKVALIADDALTVSFTVTANASPVEGVAVQIAGHTLITGADGKTESLTLNKGEYDYTVQKAGYVTAAGSVDLSATSQEVAVTLEEAATLTFVVKDAEGTSVQGAEVTVEGKKLTTGADGSVAFEGLEPKEYNYTVSKAGYKTVSDKVTLEEGGTTVDVTLEAAASTLTFVVKSAAGAVQGAEVMVEGKKLTTGADGKAAFEGLALNKEYSYTVSKTDYKPVSGKATLKAGGTTVEVTLEKVSAVESVLLSVVTLRPNPASAVLHVANASAVEQLKVVTLHGEILLQLRNADGASEVAVPLESVAEGMYMLVVEGDGAQRAIPFVVAR